MKFSLITYKHNYPILVNGWIKVGDEEVELDVPVKDEWRAHLGNPLTTEEEQRPENLYIKFQALSKSRYDYSCDFSNIKNFVSTFFDSSYTQLSLTLAIAPNGLVVLWISDNYKAKILDIKRCTPIDDEDVDIDWKFKVSMLEYVTKWREVRPCDDIFGTGLHDLMKTYTYRYLILSRDKDSYSQDIKEDLSYCISDLCFNGTYDKQNDGYLFQYHEAGKPKNLSVSWQNGKNEYAAYFWIEEKQITEIFNRFYGAHPDTKTDFIIHIDAKSKKYELGLYRQGLKEPVVIPECAYQLIVFKNKYEDYRSENYNQPRGAWIW